MIKTKKIEILKKNKYFSNREKSKLTKLLKKIFKIKIKNEDNEIEIKCLEFFRYLVSKKYSIDANLIASKYDLTDYKNIKRLKELSIRIFKILNLRGFTRSEFIIENNIPYLLDINTVPGLTKESILPKQLLAANISLESFFNDLLNEALNKKP